MIRLCTSRYLGVDDVRASNSAARVSICALCLTLAMASPALAGAQTSAGGCK